MNALMAGDIDTMFLSTTAAALLVMPMLGFKSFRFAQAVISGIEIMHMIKKGQLSDCVKGQVASAAAKFYSLAF